MATRTLYPNSFVGPIPTGSSYGQLPSVQQPTRNLEYNAGNPAEILRSSQTQASSLGQSSGDDLQGVMDLLRQAQRTGQNKVISGQREQVTRGSADLPTDLAGMQLSPSQILNFKRGEQAAVEPTIGGARDLVSEAKSVLDNYKATQESAKKQAADFINLALEQGGSDGLESLLKTNPELFKAAGYDSNTFAAILPAIKAKETTKDITYSIQDVGGRTIRYGFDKAGNVVSQNDLGASTQTSPDSDLGKLLTPAEAQNLGVPYGTTRGGAANLNITPQKPLTEGARVNKINAESGLRALATIKSELFDQNGNLRESILLRKNLGGARNYTSAQNEVMDIIARLRTGAALTIEEQAFYKNQLPGIRDNKETVINKLKRFETIFNEIITKPGAGRSEGTESAPVNSSEPTAFTPKGTTRTDRHNNPTAFTTDIAKIAGLKEGVDYVKGDPFSGGRYFTAKLLGDPIATTIKVIDKIGFKTQSGGNRWTYTDSIPATKNWSKLSFGQKLEVLDQMYKKENGSKSDIRRFA